MELSGEGQEGLGMAVPQRAAGTALELRELWNTALSHRVGWCCVELGWAQSSLWVPCNSGYSVVL